MREGIGGEQDPFYVDRLAMRSLHIAGVNEVKRYAPNMDFGITFIPAPPHGERHSSWVGGWCMGIPKGCRNPDRAWEFIRWFCHSDEGTSLVGDELKLLPGVRKSPFFERANEKEHYAQYVRILEESRHQRPVMPAQALYMREMQRAVESAIFGKKTPEKALEDARRNTQSELDLILAG
jgi:multiple sugar transport system substrate-binding protein